MALALTWKSRKFIICCKIIAFLLVLEGCFGLLDAKPYAVPENSVPTTIFCFHLVRVVKNSDCTCE